LRDEISVEIINPLVDRMKSIVQCALLSAGNTKVLPRLLLTFVFDGMMLGLSPMVELLL